ncbi:MAG: 8-amino-7-oxononanoate synthase [Gammaproteobacteria bacterium]|nr:8-amino-7-oxononanoate synthase [Gammaproteobacteria bacterium]
MILENSLQHKLKERTEKNLFRQRFKRSTPIEADVIVDGKKYLNFSSNDYLGLANHPHVIHAFKKGVDQYGVGSGASALLGGYTHAHHALEEELAHFFNYPRCLLFSSGFMANSGVIHALTQKKDSIFIDKLAHASLIDASLSSPAALFRYKHNNTIDLKHKLKKSIHAIPFLITEGVFSMEGDLACLEKLISIKNETKGVLIVDDAHGIGVIGNKGQGSTEGKQHAVSMLVGTFGKALGTSGAFVAGSDVSIEALIQYARSYIYTTAQAPALCEATRASLKLLESETWRRTHLNNLIAYFQTQANSLGLTILKSSTPIQAILLGEDKKTMICFEQLKKRGVWVAAIRPPTVPPGRSLLRITLNAHHQISHLDYLLSCLSYFLINKNDEL